AAGDIVAAAAQLMPDLARAIATLAAVERVLDGNLVQLILPGPIRCQSRIARHGLDGVIRRWCDPQNPADRTDTMDTALIIDEHDHLRNGQSSIRLGQGRSGSQSRLSRSKVFARIMMRRMMAVMATFFALPALSSC